MSVLLLTFPVILRDVNAESALVSSLGMVGIVLVMYYLRMVKREVDFNRLRVAVGGICLGIGLILLVISSFIVQESMLSIMFLVALISIVAGILNIFVPSRKID